MTINLTKGEQRVYPYRYPVISMAVPSAWIEESVQYDKWCSEIQNQPRFRGWQSARRIGKRAFAAYFNIADQWIEYHKEWSARNPVYDFIIEGQKFKVHTAPSFDWTPNLGRTLKYSIKKPDEDSLIHICQSYSLPYVDIIGFVPNETLTKGPNKLSERDLQQITSHKVLKSVDDRCLYL